MTQAAIESAGADGDRATALPCGVADADAVQALFDAVQQRCGWLDLLFNNAGGGLASESLDLVTPAKWRQIVDVNLNGACYGLLNAFRPMKAQTPMGGRIINKGSLSAHAPRRGSIGYRATKHAVTGLTMTFTATKMPFVGRG